MIYSSQVDSLSLPRPRLRPRSLYNPKLRTRDPATGEPLSGEQTAAVSEDVKPVSVGVRGNYAVSISWSDGHRGAIYSYQVLRKIAEQHHHQQQQQQQ